MPEGPAPAPVIQRLRVRYAKRGRLRFTSHRDISRAVERAVRRAGIPVAFSAGFTPHPKISYAGAAATGVASEAEYLEIGLIETRDPARVRADLDAALPPGLDIVDVVPVGAGRAADAQAKPGAFADRLQASEWRIRLDGVSHDDAAAAVAAFLDARDIEVERLTKKGRRRFDVRAAVLTLEAPAPGADRRAAEAADAPCAILRMVVRHSTPAVRPDDILTGLRQVADLAPPSPPLVTRLAQGPLDAATGGLADPLDPDREIGLPSGDDAETARGPVRSQPGEPASADAVSA
ncbi:TIGR03936 family radical SAM-associated protein [Actinomadura macra]|uniref:TIGR03936 family radical SAM-associated protein n=1 Tax=Actinomadura macra TaxID=46164 RepID=UPI0008379631|nr:TIGR03936 family radical SAM-associated protein [Actinomadura macra]